MVHCNICLKSDVKGIETTSVRSNVRKFRDERFEIWRCPDCFSIHASHPVDLDYYYKHYPLHHLQQTKVDWMLKAMYRNLLSRLKRAGLEKKHAILDYGCGSGLLVDYLRSAGYTNADGYDAYSDRFGDGRVLEQKFDFIISQDVIEHIDEPWNHVEALDRSSKPGTVIAIGTPNAESIDMKNPQRRIHTLHQPYHRHILSRTALLGVGRKFGWKLLRYYPTMYTNTLVPFVNIRFVTYYFSCFDNTLDLSLEPIRINSWRLLSPLALFYGLFGYFVAPETDVMAVYQK